MIKNKGDMLKTGILVIFAIVFVLTNVSANNYPNSEELKVPYIHQRFDTSADFVGANASAPASAVMVLRAHGKLSSSYLGRYVSKSYTYNSYEFDIFSSIETSCSGNDAEGRGAWGFIYKDSKINDRDYMVRQNLEKYLQKHGLETSVEWSPTRDDAEDIIVREINEKRPVIVRSGLMDKLDHYVVIVGYERDGGIEYLVNDPNGYRSYYKDDPCWGCDNVERGDRPECSPPARYTYGELGLGGSGRALILAGQEGIGSEKEEEETDEGRDDHESESFVDDKAGILSDSVKSDLKEKLKNHRENNKDYLAVITLDSSYVTKENVSEASGEKVKWLRGVKREENKRNPLVAPFYAMGGWFSRNLGLMDGSCVAVAVVREEDSPVFDAGRYCNDIVEDEKWVTSELKKAYRRDNYDSQALSMINRATNVLGGLEDRDEREEDRDIGSQSKAEGYLDLDVTQTENTDKSEIREYLKYKGKEQMLEHVDDLYELGRGYNIDPAFGAAVMAQESSWATSEAYVKCRNGFGQMDKPVLDFEKCEEHSEHKNLVKYPDVRTGIETFYKRIREIYVNENGQHFPHEISCVWNDESPTEPCYVGGTGTDRRSWNANVPRIVQEIRNYGYRDNENCEHLIVLDPGHGGPQPGTREGTIDEKVINLDIVQKLKPKLREIGLKNVLVTRLVDRNLTLYQRTKFANSAFDNGYNLDNAIFVSVHANSYWGEKDVYGTETFYHPGDNEYRTERSVELAEEIEEELSSSLGFYSRGVKTDENLNDWKGLWVTVKTDMPAALTETGFMDDKDNREVLESEEGREDAAKGIKRGIVQYFKARGYPDSCLN